jgi:heme exporter protein A
MLEIIELACVRGNRALFSGLNLTVTPGLLVAIVGENGSGKSSLLRMLSGLLPREQGVIRWNGTDIDELKDDYRRHLTYLGHLNGIKDDLTPIENLQISAELFGDDRSAISAREALQAVGLGGHTQSLPTRVLSQGQKRRVTLARLWLSKRPLWILDEPFAALDDVGTALLTEQLSRHLDAGGMAVVATHQAVGVRQESLRSLRLPG